MPPQVRNILNQLSSPHQDQKHKAMEQARGDPDLLASIISMHRPCTSRGMSPGMGCPADTRNSPYAMNSMQPYIGSGSGAMHGGISRPMRLPSQSIMQPQGRTVISFVLFEILPKISIFLFKSIPTSIYSM